MEPTSNNEQWEGKETNLVAQVLIYFKYSKRFLLHRTQSGKVMVSKHGRLYWMQLAPKGTPDIEGLDLIKGCYIGIECKVKGGKISPEQKEFAEKIRSTANGIHIFARSLNDVLDVLEPREPMPF